MNLHTTGIPVTELKDEATDKAAIKLFIKRLDLIHPVVSGNKWFKLKYNLIKAQEEQQKTILTFGGAYSNHIAATAAAARLNGLNSIGVIRGEEPKELNAVLNYALKEKMQLHFISRSDYKRKTEKEFLSQLKLKFDDPYIIPEGGANTQGVKGCTEILSEDEKYFDYIICACGTATTLAGLIISCSNKDTKLIGISVLKNELSLNTKVKNYIDKSDTLNMPEWKLLHQYHFGGYAKFTPSLLSFTQQFKIRHNIYTEVVYTGKALFAVYDLLNQGFFETNSRILFIHTGGFRADHVE